MEVMPMGKIKLTSDNLRTIGEAFEEFQKFNKIKDLSEWTIRSYQASYKVFTEYYSEENLCDSLNVQVLNNFIGYLKDNRQKDDFVHDFEAALKGAYPVQGDGKILFPFTRIFFTAKKALKTRVG